MAYSFDHLFAADPANPNTVARNASIIIHEVNDATKTPVALTTVDGQPYPNPVTTNANGFAAIPVHESIDRLAWSGGGFTGTMTSYEGMKAEAVAARTAAETAAANAATQATVRLDELIAAGNFEGPAGPLTNITVGTVEATPGNPLTDDIIASEVTNGTATKAALNATYARAVSLSDPRFAAVGDGIADDTTQVQAALDTGLNVYVPKGKTYLVAGVTLMADGQRVYGPGTLKLKVSAYASVISATGRKNVHISVNVDGNAAGNPLDNGAYTFGGSTVSADDLAAIKLTTCTDSEVVHSRVTNAHSSPIVLRDCTRSTAAHNVVVNPRREGIGILGGYACRIESNIAYGDSTAPLPWSLIWTGGITDSDVGGHWHKVINNYVANSQAAFITVNTMNTEVAGNTVVKTLGNEFSTGPGIRLGHNIERLKALGSIARGNTISGMKATVPFGGTGGNRGISVDNAMGALVVDNDIRECERGVGVSVVSGQVVDIIDNRIKTTIRAIETTNVAGGTIARNLVDGGERGVYFQGAGASILGNIIKGTSIVGLTVANGAGDLSNMRIIDNRVHSPAAGDLYLIEGTPVERYGNLGDTYRRKGTITLANSWVAFGEPHDVPTGYRTTDGMVVLDGAMKSGTVTAGTSFGTLPAGFRPAKRVRFLAQNAGGTPHTADIYVEPTGQMFLAQAVVSNTIVSLSGIIFPAA